MNTYIYEPIPEIYTFAKYTLPAGASSPHLRINVADRTEADNFNYTKIGKYRNQLIGSLTTPKTLNALNLHRNGPYQNPAWKQSRGGEHPISRYLKRNNFIGCTQDRIIKPPLQALPRRVEDTTTTFYYEPAVQKRSLPFMVMLGVKSVNPLSGIVEENPVPLGVSLVNAYSFANYQLKNWAMGINNLLKPSLNEDEPNPNGGVKYQEPGLKTDTPYGPLMKMIQNMDSPQSPIDSFIEAVYSAPTFPAPKNKFSGQNRKRTNYNKSPFFNSSRRTRTIDGSDKF